MFRGFPEFPSFFRTIFPKTLPARRGRPYQKTETLAVPRAGRQGERKIFRIRCQPGGKRVSKNVDAPRIREEEGRWKPC